MLITSDKQKKHHSLIFNLIKNNITRKIKNSLHKNNYLLVNNQIFFLERIWLKLILDVKKVYNGKDIFQNIFFCTQDIVVKFLQVF
jgi:hypothetical protein